MPQHVCARLRNNAAHTTVYLICFLNYFDRPSIYDKSYGLYLEFDDVERKLLETTQMYVGKIYYESL